MGYGERTTRSAQMEEAAERRLTEREERFLGEKAYLEAQRVVDEVAVKFMGEADLQAKALRARIAKGLFDMRVVNVLEKMLVDIDERAARRVLERAVNR